MRVEEIASFMLDVDTPEDLDALAEALADSPRRDGRLHPRRARAACSGDDGAARAPAPRDPRDRAGRRSRRGARRRRRAGRRPASRATCSSSRTRSSPRPRARSSTSRTSRRPRAPASSPRSTARTRAPSRSCSTRPPRSCASGPGVLICRTHHGFVCANAGVDASNAGADDRLVTLPRDPDASARALRAAIPGPAGRRDLRLVRPRVAPRPDRGGDRRRRAAAARGLARAHATPRAASCARRGSRSPTRRRAPPTSSAARTSACPPCCCAASARLVTADDGPGARALLRPREEDLFA